mmetsp:Transcript_19659/g.25459  ORF Transcript_19659/g.25459 Transcript_19659/m.25459 type:complete len:163 (-) Transcript_19659:144-632(-)
MSAKGGLKVNVVGPKCSGKTTIANFLASDEVPAFSLKEHYSETVGCRILECERNFEDGLINIELWDTSGSTDYESCWPAVMKDAAGTILVYNPENEAHVSESGAWYDFFVKNNGLRDEQCIVFAFCPKAEPGMRQRTSPKLQHLNVMNVSLEDGRSYFFSIS